MRILTLLLIVAGLAGVTRVALACLHPAAQIAAAEIAFAHDSVARGLNTAFAAHFADHAVDFAPLPRPNARRFYMAQANPAAVLDWYPAFTLSAASGDFGLSTGPFEMRDAEGVPFRHGHYISIWERQSNGEWKVLIDGGITHPRQEIAPPRLAPGTMPARELEADAAWHGDPANVLADAERALAVLANASTLRDALARVGDDGLRLYRDGVSPRTGKAEALAFAAALDGRWQWQVEGADIAGSGDLGFTYGRSMRTNAAGSENGTFIHVWRRTPDGWRLLLTREAALPST